MHNRSRMIWTLHILILVALLNGSRLAPAYAQGPDATVIPDTLNMRYGPGGQYAVVAQLARGAELALLASDDLPNNGIWVWARTADGIEGWVSSDYLSIRPDLSLDALPVRPAPDIAGHTG